MEWVKVTHLHHDPVRSSEQSHRFADLIFIGKISATLLRIYREKRIRGIVSAKDRDDFKLTASNSRVHLFVKELTRDHHPDQDDERLRIETYGGYVVELGSVPRVNGQLAISRAIGDVSFKR